MGDKHQSLYPGNFYHIYNRGNNRENLFYGRDNYIYFLKKYDQYLYAYLETYAYCLLPNHFHLLVRVKELQDLPGFGNPAGLSGKDLPGLGDLEGLLPRLISKQFSRFFNAYAKAINKQQHRVGSLFQKNFKRIHIDHQLFLTNLIYFIHSNPQRHGLINDFKNWPYSSYWKILVTRKSHLKKETVLSWFGGINEYKTYHATTHSLKKSRYDQFES